MAVAFIKSKTDTGPVWINVSEILTFESAGKNEEITVVRMTGDYKLILSESVDDVYDSIRSVIA